MAKIIGIIGSRDRDDQDTYAKILTVFDQIYTPGDWVCSGGCSRGGDRFAKLIANKYKTPYLEFPADWDGLGKAAGMIRNVHIAKACHVLIASPSNPGCGTRHTIKKFIEFHGKEGLHTV